jgi:EAL domain-containing protein (putative c-di-GMP-specific phosphodiesterase class I)
LQSIQHAIARSGISPQRLELEITESVMLHDAEAVFKILAQLRHAGIRIALDDFGTGYSSFSNLRRFAFDKIKIDRSFVRDLSDTDGNAIALVRSIAQLGLSLRIVTTAEGVETKAQLDRLRSEGYTEVQGYYLYRPTPAHHIGQLLQRQQSASAA